MPHEPRDLAKQIRSERPTNAREGPGATAGTRRSARGEPERVELAPAAAALFRALGHPARLAILRRLAAHGPARVVDLVAEVGLAQSTMSKHLACLRGCGLVTSTPAGRASVFALAEPAHGDGRLLGYSDLLEALAPTPAARQGLLAGSSSPHPTTSTPGPRCRAPRAARSPAWCSGVWSGSCSPPTSTGSPNARSRRPASRRRF